MAGPLEGLRVIDLSSGPVGGMATMVLSDFGADVVKIERPGGDPFRFMGTAPMWLRGKRSVELDLTRKIEQERLYDLTATADVVISSFRAHSAVDLGCDYDVLASKNSSIVYVQISGFERYGPYVGFPGYEGIVAAKSGRMQNFAGTVNREGPQFAAVQVASHAASQAAVTAVLAGLIARQRIGIGQYIETSMLRGMLPYEQGGLFRRQLASLDPAQFGDDPLAAGQRMPTIQYQPVRTKGGEWMQLGNLLRQQFDSFLAASDLHDVIVDDRTQGSPALWDPEVLEEVRDKVLTRMQEKTADEWVAHFTELGNIAAHKFQTTQEALDDPDITANNHVVEVKDPRLGIQIKDQITIMESMLGQVQVEADEQQGRSDQLGLLADMEHTPGEVGSAAPVVGQHTFEVFEEERERERWHHEVLAQDDYDPPLQGVTVLEFASIIAAPLGASQLADLGARVIKVEPIGGDPYRQLGGGVGAMRVNASKESISLDLKSEAGQEILKKLLEKTDLIISNFRPGVPERLGFGYEQVKELRPEIVYLAMNGYGRKGPGAHRPSAHPVPGAAAGGALFQAGAGFPPPSEDGELSLEEIREISRRLFRANEVNPDPNTSMVVMSAAMLGLYAQKMGLGGQRIWLDMFGCNAYANADDFIRYRDKPERAVPDAELMGTGPLSRLYRCQDGGWVFLEIVQEKEWHRFADRIESPELATDQRFSSREGRAANAALLTELLEDLFATESADHWEQLLSVIGIGCVRADGPAAAEFWEVDEHAGQNGLVAPVLHQKWGSLLRHGPLWKTHRSGLNIGPAPVIGEHTDAILEELGYDADAIAQLREDRVVDSEVVEPVEA